MKELLLSQSWIESKFAESFVTNTHNNTEAIQKVINHNQQTNSPTNIAPPPTSFYEIFRDFTWNWSAYPRNDFQNCRAWGILETQLAGQDAI